MEDDACEPGQIDATTNKLKDMTFKVERDWHRWFKKLAVEADMSMKDIFKLAVDEWAARRFMSRHGR